LSEAATAVASLSEAATAVDRSGPEAATAVPRSEAEVTKWNVELSQLNLRLEQLTLTSTSSAEYRYYYNIKLLLLVKLFLYSNEDVTGCIFLFVKTVSAYVSFLRSFFGFSYVFATEIFAVFIYVCEMNGNKQEKFIEKFETSSLICRKT
jgi:hypothetical protein